MPASREVAPTSGAAGATPCIPLSPLDISGVASVSAFGEEVHLHHENAVTPADSQRLAQIRAEELKSRELVFRGGGRVLALRSGYLFTLEDHPRGGVDGEYLVTELSNAIAAANTDATAATPIVTTLNTDIGTAISSACTAAGLDPTTFKPMVPVPATPPPAPAATMPTLPGASATPTYINITHPTWQTTTLTDTGQPIDQPIDQWITSQATAHPTLNSDRQTTDSTATDLGNGPALNPGSDVKIVGGDNVTMVAHDTRSQVEGTSYGLVLGGQASVVRNGQQSKVFAPSKSSLLLGISGAPTILLMPSDTSPPTLGAWSPPASDTPGRFPPLSYPLPQLDTASTTAQRSEAYGDTFSWVDGKTTSTVTGGTHVMVLAPARSRDRSTRRPLWPTLTNPLPWLPSSDKPGFMSNVDLLGDLPSDVDAVANEAGFFRGHVDPELAQATRIFGNQGSFVDGDQSARITGRKRTTVEGGQETIINGGQTTYADSQTTHADKQTTYVENSTKTALMTEDFNFIMKLAVNLGIAASFNTFKVDITVFKLANEGIRLAQSSIYMNQHGGHFSMAGIHNFT